MTVEHPSLLPFRVDIALRTAGAPAEGFASLTDVVAWAETHLGFDFTCGPRTPGAGNAGRARHWVKIDPHTGDCTPAVKPGQETKADGVHLLAALTGTQTECEKITPRFRDWVGIVHPGEHAPWPKGGAANAHLGYLRNVVRVVQFIDEGLCLHAHEEWLRIGAHPDNVWFAQAYLARRNIQDKEPALCAHLARITGVEWNALRGRKAETSAEWLNNDIRDWADSNRL